MTISVERMERVRQAMTEHDLEVLLLSVGADLPWLTGYEAMPLERLTMLVVPRDAQATLVVPGLEAPRVTERPELFDLHPWSETDDPTDIVAGLVGPARRGAIGDQTWARFVVELQAAAPQLTLSRAGPVVGPLRAVKEPSEIDMLARAGAAVDRIAARLQAGEIELVGHTEAEVSAEIGRQILAEGHHKVNFAIVAAGEHAASPHHDAGSRRIEAGEVVLCDFGGTMLGPDGIGYCSDITRCVWTGSAPAEFAGLYEVLQRAQAASVQAVQPGVAAEAIDAAARDLIADAGMGEYFVHRTGHGIGVEAHEDPYIVAGNRDPVVAGNAFSIEPGIYLPDRWGARLEDIVVVTDDGVRPLNRVPHELAEV